MSGWLYVLVVTGAYIGVVLQFAAFVGRQLRAASGCTCVKGGWDPACPLHGRREP